MRMQPPRPLITGSIADVAFPRRFLGRFLASSLFHVVLGDERSEVSSRGKRNPFLGCQDGFSSEESSLDGKIAGKLNKKTGFWVTL